MTSPADAPLRITIFGASGATGRHAIKAARAKGHIVRAVDHHLPDDTGTDPKVTHVEGDVLSDDLRTNVRGADAVLSCLGVGNDIETLLSPPPLYSDGTENICKAMLKEGVARLIVISASFVEEKNRGPIWFKLPAMTALHPIFRQMAKMESNLKARPQLDWTAVRPGWLMDGVETRDYVVQAYVIPEELIRTRHADLAHFMVSLAESGEWVHQTPAIAREEPAAATAPDKVIEEMLD